MCQAISSPPLHKPSHGWTIRPMIKNRLHADSRNSAGVGFVTEKLGFGIKCCELALPSGSARTWEHKIKNAQKAHDTALRFVHRFDLSEPFIAFRNSIPPGPPAPDPTIPPPPPQPELPPEEPPYPDAPTPNPGMPPFPPPNPNEPEPQPT